jgi:PPOX class probable F420-dependent enzyme
VGGGGSDTLPGVDIAAARYVSLTTYRRNGEAVPVPVWIAPLGDGRVGFTTDASSGKAKRIRNRADVTLRECSMRGEVAAGTAEVRGTAEIVADGPDHAATVAAVRKKYGIQFVLIDLGGRLKRLVGRADEPAAAIVITLR